MKTERRSSKIRTINTNNPTRLDDMAQRMKTDVVDQEEAVNALINMWRVHSAGFHDPNRPLGIAMLMGPTGCGKTYLIETLAKEIHGSHKKMIKVNCAEFQSDHEIAKLIGSPPGYLGHRETSPVFSQETLDNITSQNSLVQIILLDEFDKAANALFRLMLGIFDKGHMTTGDNRQINFTNSMIFMTSNLGVENLHAKQEIGVADGNTRSRKYALIEAARRVYSPEFMNRLDHVIQMNTLSVEAIRRILRLEISKIEYRLRGKIELTERGEEELMKLGYSAEYGAREMKRTLHRHIVVPLANARLNDESLNHVVVGYKNGAFIYGANEIDDTALGFNGFN